MREDSDRSKAHDDRADAAIYAITELRGLSGGSWMGAYSMVKCEECRHVYRDDKTKCPQCGLERDVFDPPERQKGPGAQFREGGGGMNWAEAYAPDRQETAAERNYRYLQEVIAMQQGQIHYRCQLARTQGNPSRTQTCAKRGLRRCRLPDRERRR